jgi:hypothetical protein
MEAGFIVISCMVFALGLAVGITIATLRRIRAITYGTIYVDCSDPDGIPNMFLESNVQVAELVSRKRVMCDVVVVRYNSRK